ncbi:MAG: hypothetical protein K2O60_06105, partial [Ruminococcus sp.]|nr:hypothetical protein [Ruminococcus sp.]
IYPFIYGIFGSLGLICFINVFCVFDYRISEHPYAHPFCIIAGSLSLLVCLAIFVLDIVAFIDENKKIRRLLIEFIITLISFFGFIFVWSGLWNAVSEFIKYKGW